MPRAKAQFDLDQVEKLAAIGCTVEEIASWFGVERKTIQRHCAEEDFAAALESGRRLATMSVRRKQMEILQETVIGHDGKPRSSRNAATMAIWLGKQLCGQREQVGVASPDGGPMQHAVLVKFVDAPAPRATNGHAAGTLPAPEPA